MQGKGLLWIEDYEFKLEMSIALCHTCRTYIIEREKKQLIASLKKKKPLEVKI